MSEINGKHSNSHLLQAFYLIKDTVSMQHGTNDRDNEYLDKLRDFCKKIDEKADGIEKRQNKEMTSIDAELEIIQKEENAIGSELKMVGVEVYHLPVEFKLTSDSEQQQVNQVTEDSKIQYDEYHGPE